MVLAMVGVERGSRTPDPFFGWLARRGLLWAAVTTALQMIDGFWFLFALPRELLIALVGGQAWPTLHLALGMGLGFLALILLSGPREPERQRTLVRFTAAVVGVTVFAMVGLRDVVRAMYLSPAIRPGELPRSTQLDVTILFIVVFVLGLATVAWMLRAVSGRQRARPRRVRVFARGIPPDDPAGPPPRR